MNIVESGLKLRDINLESAAILLPKSEKVAIIPAYHGIDIKIDDTEWSLVHLSNMSRTSKDRLSWYMQHVGIQEVFKVDVGDSDYHDEPVILFRHSFNSSLLGLIDNRLKGYSYREGMITAAKSELQVHAFNILVRYAVDDNRYIGKTVAMICEIAQAVGTEAPSDPYHGSNIYVDCSPKTARVIGHMLKFYGDNAVAVSPQNVRQIFGDDAMFGGDMICVHHMYRESSKYDRRMFNIEGGCHSVGTPGYHDGGIEICDYVAAASVIRLSNGVLEMCEVLTDEAADVLMHEIDCIVFNDEPKQDTMTRQIASYYANAKSEKSVVETVCKKFYARLQKNRLREVSVAVRRKANAELALSEAMAKMKVAQHELICASEAEASIGADNYRARLKAGVADLLRNKVANKIMCATSFAGTLVLVIEPVYIKISAFDEGGTKSDRYFKSGAIKLSISMSARRGIELNVDGARSYFDIGMIRVIDFMSSFKFSDMIKAARSTVHSKMSGYDGVEDCTSHGMIEVTQEEFNANL